MAAAPVAIRPLTAADATAYRRLRLQGLRECPTAFGASHRQEGARPLAFFRERIAFASDRWVLGAFADAVLVGVVGFVRDAGLKTRHKGFIWGMYVAPDHRGQGLGRALMVAALARIAARRVRSVRLTVTAANTAARRLYATLGFIPFGEEPEALYVNGHYHTELYLVRRMDSAAPRSSRRGTPRRP